MTIFDELRNSASQLRLSPPQAPQGGPILDVNRPGTRPGFGQPSPLDIGGAVVNAARDFIIRPAAQSTIRGLNQLTGTKSITPDSRVPGASFFLGNEPIGNLEDYGKSTLKVVGANQGFANQFALPAGLALGALDVLPFGPGKAKGVLRAAKEGSLATKLIEETKPIIKAIKVADKPTLPASVVPKLTAYSAQATPKTLAKIATRGATAAERTAKQDFNAYQTALFAQENAPKRTLTGAAGAIGGGIRAMTTGALSRLAPDLKDISGFSGQFRDVYRNFQAVFGKSYGLAKQLLLNPLDASKGKYVDFIKSWTDRLNTEVVKGLGITKGSKLSQLVQQYGEGLITIEDLRHLEPKNWSKVIQADKFFRSAYDELLQGVNVGRSAENQIPRRADYYRHFQELSGFGGLKNLFETPAGIPSNLAGKSADLKPKSRFLSFAQQRLGISTTEDAVGGFLNYLPSASYAIHVDPHIAKFRALAEELAGQTTDTRHLNNFIEFLHSYANDLAGKTNPADRFLQMVIPGGRRTMAAIDWLNRRVKANVILGNASSSIAQIFNVPQAIASAKQYSAQGLARTFADFFHPNPAMAQSAFIKERYSHSLIDRFDTGLLANQKRFAVWMTGVLDEVGTKFAWNAHYAKGVAEGVDNPVKYADDMARSLVAGRGIGEVPLIQKSKIFQLVAPFQLEVANLWHVQKDFVSRKDFAGLAALFIADYVFNKGAEQIRGSAVTLDPIQAGIDSYQAAQGATSPQDAALRVGGRLGGEVLSNLPLGQTLASVLPLTDEQKKEYFGRQDPTRFGAGLLIAQGLSDPVYKVLFPFGGGQAKKSIEGELAYNRGYGQSPAGKFRYPIAQDAGNQAKSILFGQYATPDAQNYFNNSRAPLSDNQAKRVLQSPDRQQEYQKVLDERKVRSDQIKATKNEQSSVPQALAAESVPDKVKISLSGKPREYKASSLIINRPSSVSPQDVDYLSNQYLQEARKVIIDRDSAIYKRGISKDDGKKLSDFYQAQVNVLVEDYKKLFNRDLAPDVLAALPKSYRDGAVRSPALKQPKKVKAKKTSGVKAGRVKTPKGTSAIRYKSVKVKLKVKGGSTYRLKQPKTRAVRVRLTKSKFKIKYK